MNFQIKHQIFWKTQKKVRNQIISLFKFPVKQLKSLHTSQSVILFTFFVTKHMNDSLNSEAA